MTWRAGLEAWAHRQWASRGPVAWLLSPLSLVFLAVSRSRRERTVPNRLPVPSSWSATFMSAARARRP